jgi:hypothetical protein
MSLEDCVRGIETARSVARSGCSCPNEPWLIFTIGILLVALFATLWLGQKQRKGE